MSSTDGRLRGRTRRGLSWVFVLVLGAAWWLTLAPTSVGGPAVFASVQGHSMEPLLHTGDLVITHRQSRYEIGDLVVVSVDGGHVIHRLYGGSASTGWITKGDNRATADSWRVPEDRVLGRARWTVPGFADRLASLHGRWPRAALVAGFTLLVLLPRRRRTNSRLEAALAGAVRVPVPCARPALELAGLASAAVCALVSAVGVWSSVRVGGAAATVPMLAFLISAGGAGWLGARVFLGAGRPEPARALAVLGDRVIGVASLPAAVEDQVCTGASSAWSLRRLADADRLPVLYLHSATGDRLMLMREDDIVELRPGADSHQQIPVLERLLWQS